MRQKKRVLLCGVDASACPPTPIVLTFVVDTVVAVNEELLLSCILVYGMLESGAEESCACVVEAERNEACVLDAGKGEVSARQI